MNVKSRTLPNCARCSNHGLKIKLRAHKRFCAYRYCHCEKCKITNERQRDMALQTAMRRANAQDESRALIEGQSPQQPKVPMPIVIKNELAGQENDDVDSMSVEVEYDRPDSGFDARDFNEDSEPSVPTNLEPGLPIQNNTQFTEDDYRDGGEYIETSDFFNRFVHF